MPSSCQFAVVDTATASFWKKSSAPSASMMYLAAIRRVEHELPLRMDLLGMRLAGAELVGRDDVFLLLNGLEIDLEARLQRCRILLVVVRRFLLGALETAGENGFRGSWPLCDCSRFSTPRRTVCADPFFVPLMITTRCCGLPPRLFAGALSFGRMGILPGLFFASA